MPARTPSTLITVVLCRRDCAPRLRLALESLCLQTLARDLFEVVVVDDGSSDDTRQAVRDFEARLPVRYSRQRPAGIATARNHGLFLARGTLVLFLDDDGAEATLLERHVAAHKRFPEPWFAVVGAARLDTTAAKDPLVRFMSERRWPPLELPPLPASKPLDPRWFRAGRSSCKRGFLVQKGIFNASFRNAGEDLELGVRLAEHRFGIVHAPDAVTVAAWPRDVGEACLAQYREGEAAALVQQLHPRACHSGFRARQAAERWDEVKAVYEAVVRSARELDRLARTYQGEGLQMPEPDRSLLHRSYAAALAASWLKGFVDSARVDGGAA